MRFEWDEAKNRANIRKHRIDFADIPQVFDGPMVVALDTRKEYGEDRWIGTGFLRQAVVVVVFVETSLNTIRIISARKAEKHEREKFKEEIQDRLGLSGL
jgi:uncharacterized DUF497 family protein